MKNKLWIVDLESIATRYTCEWKTHVPHHLAAQGFDVRVIDGPSEIPECTTPGAFLNFSGTNWYKSHQVMEMSRLFSENLVTAGDVFLFTDAWHPGIINLKYMSHLLNVPIHIMALWHAGSYDPQDFLGRLVGSRPWIRHAEMAMFDAIDTNCFATEFHRKLFADVFDLNVMQIRNKTLITGWPMEYMQSLLTPLAHSEKTNTIVFPHRIAPEKQLDIFRDLQQQLPQYNWVVCQDQQLTKSQYHKLLASSKLLFSASLQETLGICTGAEAPLLGVVPMVPSRLSYWEMFRGFDFLYPSQWTESRAAYEIHRSSIMIKITELMDNWVALQSQINDYVNNRYQRYFHCDALIERIKDVIE